METFKSNDNPFLKIDPFEKGNIFDKFEMFVYLLIYLIKAYESCLLHSNFLDSYFAF